MSKSTFIQNQYQPPTQSTPPVVGVVKHVFLVVLGFLILAGAAHVGYWYGTQRFRQTSAPTFSDFVEMAGSFAKPATGAMGGGAVPVPPRAFLKKTESFAEKWVKIPAKATYTFFDYAADPLSTNTLVTYVAPDPFRWRVDFVTKREGTDYKTIYLYDGDNYSSCNIVGDTLPDCYQAPVDFLEKEIQIPIPLTELLNDTLDSIVLEELVLEVAKLGQVSGQERAREIAGYSGECSAVSTEYRIFDFCVAEGTNLLLFLDVKSTSAKGKILRQFTLTAQEVDLSPDLRKVFTLP